MFSTEITIFFSVFSSISPDCEKLRFLYDYMRIIISVFAVDVSIEKISLHHLPLKRLLVLAASVL